MKTRLISVLVAVAVIGGYAGYAWYKGSDHYRARFEPRFRDLNVGDTYQRMTDLLGTPTHYCIVKEIRRGNLGDTHVPIGRYEIYRLGDRDYRAEFQAPDPQPASVIVLVETIERSNHGYCRGTAHRWLNW